VWPSENICSSEAESRGTYFENTSLKIYKTSFFLWYPIDAREKEKENNEMASKGGLKTPHPRWRKTPTP
jgi:hypothetical protein